MIVAYSTNNGWFILVSNTQPKKGIALKQALTYISKEKAKELIKLNSLHYFCSRLCEEGTKAKQRGFEQL